MQTQTSNTLHNAIMEAGGEDRPPMLAPGNYVQWKSRIKRYIDTKPDHELIHYCLKNPPYKFTWADKQVLISEGSPVTTTETYMETYKNVLQDIHDKLNATAEAIQIILTGIDNYIYSTVDACPNACEMWKAIERLKQGESINVQDLETNLYWEFGKFTSQDGESLESYFLRFYKMMNELIRNQCDVTNHQVNVQFLLQLQPEWQRFVTLVKQRQELKTVSYHKLYDILKQHQNEVNEIRAERIARTANPLALVAQPQPFYHPQHHPTHYTQNSSTRSQQAATRNKGKAIVNSLIPIYDEEPSMVAEDKETGVGYDNQRLGNVVGARENVGTIMVQKSRIQCYNCKEFGHVARECQKPKRAKDAAYHMEKMLLCKQEEAGIQLNAEQADWRDDTDDELEDQELEAHYMYMAQIQEVSPDAADSGPIFDTEPVEQIDQNDDDNDLTNERKLLASLIEKLKCEIDDIKNHNKFLETSNKVEIDCAKARGDLISYKMESQKSFNKYTQTINDLNQTISEMKKKLSTHQETISILSQQKEAQIKLYKTRKDNELDKVIALENKVKVFDNIVYKTGQSVQTMNMLNSKCQTSFAKPEFLKKAQRANPRLYDIGCYNDNLALMLAPKSEEVIRLEKESRSKLSDLIRPFDYEKLNTLYDLFVPQREKSSEQRYFSERSRLSHTSVTNGNSKESFNKQTTLLEKWMDKSILWDQKCKSSKELFKIKRSVGTIFDGVKRCKETIAKRTYFDHIDPFIQQVIRDLHSAPQTRIMNKMDERGIVIGNKAKFVAQGHTQEEGIEYDEVFAPVARVEAIRLFLAYASFKDFVVYQMDVNSAFLYRKIKKEVYVCQPLGFKDPDFPDKVYNVEKALYGLHQASRACQDKYVNEILTNFGFSDVKTTRTPMETHKTFLKEEKGEDVDEHLYRSMIGSLIYLTSLRPDIMFTVCACARFQVNPKISHLYAVKRIFRYLKGQPKLGLWYLNDSPFDLVAYTDNDYARASLDRKSTTGGCQFLGCSEEPCVHSKTKHIEIRHHFIRDSNEKKLIQMIKIHTDKNVADLLIKAFDIIDFLNACPIKYALTVNPTIYTSCIEQFWATAKAKNINGDAQIHAKVDGKKVIISEATIRRDLKFEDERGIDCLSNKVIFEQLTLMGFENLSEILTFYKYFFSQQWKFLIHIICNA
nr:hypothetical protein [Tanacetum cinerariifolium]